MSHPRKISAQFEIVTPMFLGDANKNAARISEASIKGALVFWWRALNYAAEEGGQEEALKKMHSREQFLFGGGDSGQSRVLLKVSTQNITKTIQKDAVLNDINENVVGDGARYLGYGLMGAYGANEGKLTRACFYSGSFTVDLVIRNYNTKEDIVKDILPVLEIFGLIGSLGSRVRRGWGSVALTSLIVDGKEAWNEPDSSASYKEALKKVIGNQFRLVSGVKFPLTAFARETDIRVGEKLGTDPLGCLTDIGRGLQRYRSWGRTGNDGQTKVNGQPSEMNFRADHDWFKDRTRPLTGKFDDSSGNSHPVEALPRRAAFGLPHNYYSNDFGGMNISPENADRRASPLMFHVHKLNTGQCFTVASFFPTKFLKDDKISVSGGEKKFSFDPSTILNFLDNKRTDGTSPPNGDYFPNTKVFP